MKTTSRTVLAAGFGLAAMTIAAVAAVTPAQKLVLDQYVTAAKASAADFQGFSAERGRAFFQGTHTGGKADSPSCTSCHTSDLTKSGKTRAGKAIDPMAASVNPSRFTDPANVEKWFKRNCGDVLGRECTAAEKGDALAYMLGL
jgi:hypothetical protein